jgi:acetyl-CoA C-acetyltransferase
MPRSAFIVRVARTATGKRKGALSGYHPAVLGAKVVDALVERVGTQFDPALVDDVIFGCVSQVGTQSANLGRNVVLSSNLPISVPGTTVDRQCGSSQQAIHFAAQAVMSGTQDIVIAGGVESMSTLPIGANIGKGELGQPNSPVVQDKFGPSGFYSQFTGAEIVASKYGIDRAQMDDFAAASHAKASAAQAEGRFESEVVVVQGRDKEGAAFEHRHDEGIRPGTTVDKLATLDTLVSLGVCPPPADCPDGRVTAGNASQVSDGSAAVLICNEEGLKKLGPGVEPLAVVHTLALAGDDPITMLDAPIPATRKALERAGLRIEDIDLYEVNEAFACVPLAWQKALGADLEKLNVNGGACALGHPLGGTGAKLMSTLVSEMVRRQSRYGLQAICEGGGTANAMIVERC